MEKVIILLVLLGFLSTANGATFYKWVDEKGVVNFTDDYKKVSPEFRSRVETVEYLEAEPSSAAKIRDQADYISNRDYWKKQFDEARANYEMIREEFIREGERLVLTRYGGKTQYQMFTTPLPGIRERLETYREQLIEAKAMLDQFADEPRRKRTASDGTDIYGRDETWWKKEVTPWRVQLREAKQGYEEKAEAFVRELERLGPFRWGGLSLTQYQMISSRLTILSGGMEQYQSEISEAKIMLAKLSKEAEETKADPAWLE